MVDLDCNAYHVLWPMAKFNLSKKNSSKSVIIILGMGFVIQIISKIYSTVTLKRKPCSELPAIWDHTVLPATRHK